jgi:hypothetical protein
MRLKGDVTELIREFFLSKGNVVDPVIIEFSCTSDRAI